MLLAADYMGLPYGGEHGTELLWIADAFLCPQLPLGSRAHVDRGPAMGAAMAGARPRGWSGPGASLRRGRKAAGEGGPPGCQLAHG